MIYEVHQSILQSSCYTYIQCLNDNKAPDSTSRDHSSFRLKGGIRHYHYENILWQVHSTLCSILMMDQLSINITLGIYTYVKTWYIIFITHEISSSVYSPNILHRGYSCCCILFACDFGKGGLVLIITSETELEISRPLCKGFCIGKEFEKRLRSALRLLRDQVGFDIKRHCLSTGLRMR
jgi:hypothetical protein